ncbi:Ig-like domain-containing protein [Microcoleus sp. D3_18_C2]|uniref:Ig-like domain-containing protein n=1 Tax=Microcoleus sp. D3_18_C2 TaxID=3055334 RepID=UPI002FD06AC7
MAWTFSQKTTFTGFSAAEEAQILAALQTAYDGSSTAKTMFDNWINGGNIIDIQFLSGQFQAGGGNGRLEIDLAQLNNASYINPTGKAVKDTLVTGLVHELGHALTGRLDNVTPLDYKGDNVKFVNQIYKELGLPEQVSYLAYDRKGTLHKLNYEYTNGAAIDAARSEDADMSSAALGMSNDLLIGGSSPNILRSGDGNDFLFGAGGDDELNGGFSTDTDTGVYFGTPLDYDIQKNSDGSWSVRHARGAKDAGSDTLKNVEFVQFDGGQTYKLAQGGLTFQTDFALVIDTTGSMGSSIGRVKAQASSLIDAVFAGGNNDGRIGIVGYKDTMLGQPSAVILPFTDQDDFAARKSAAIAAINGITVSGGGDAPETAFDGLRVALDGSMGEWRFGAGVLRIALFTDAAAKDGALADQVNALASSIGATIAGRSSLAGSGGSVDTFSLAFGDDGSNGTQQRSNPGDPNANPPFPYVPSDDPITPDPTTAQVQIFTIFTGPNGVDTSALEDIADTTGGDFLKTTTNEDLVSILLNIINLPPEPVNTPPTAVNDKITTNQNIAVSINVLANDSDPNGDVITVEAFDGVSTEGGNIVLDNRGTPDNLTDDRLVYTPLATFSGSDSFTYTISDGTATATASVVVEVGVDLDGSNVTDELTGTPGDDRLNGDNGEGTLINMGGVFLGDGNDTITSTGGIYNEGVIDTGNGDDFIFVDGGVDGTGTGYGIYNNGGNINTGDGNDSIIAHEGFESGLNSSGSVFLGEGEDYIKGFGSGDFYGGNGNDTLELTPGSYTVGIWDTSATFTQGNQLMITSEFEKLIAGGTTYDFTSLTAGQTIIIV